MMSVSASTAQGASATTPTALERSRASVWSAFIRNRRAVAGAIVLGVFCVLAVLAPIIAPYPSDQMSPMDRLQPPSAAHLMGTDGLGRDVLSRTLIGGRVTLPIAILAMAVSITAGVTIGAVAGFAGGSVDSVLMRFTDLVLAFPTFFLLLTVIAMFGTNITTVIAVIGITSWGSTARILRGQVLALREELFVDSARSVGASGPRILFHHILPNTVPLIAVAATLRVAAMILVEGGLSFLGMGVQPPTPSWGNMISEGRSVLRAAWWVSLAPGAFLFLCVTSINLLGDGLRDAFDPRMRDR